MNKSVVVQPGGLTRANLALNVREVPGSTPGPDELTQASILSRSAK